jgi:hypothetical protein
MQLPQRWGTLVVRVRGRKDRAAAVTGGTGSAECLAHRATMLGPGCITVVITRGCRASLVQIEMHPGC